MAKKGSNRRRPPRNTFAVSIALIVLALAGGFFVAVQSNRAAGAETAQPQAVADAISFYEETSMQRVADIIENSDHTLVYFRSPT